MLSPRGKPLTQKKVKMISKMEGVILVCGRYEGVDQRFIDFNNLEEISIGDYVLSGGEPAAIVLIDSVVRLLSGVISNSASLKEESFNEGLLEYPLYTRPLIWKRRKVPEVLVSGNHEKILGWRKAASKDLTIYRRPDMVYEENEN